MFSIERFVVVFFPLQKFDTCKCTRNKSSFIIIIALGLSLYVFSLFTSGLEDQGSQKICVLEKKWIKFVAFMSLGDMIIAILIPLVFILIINLLISLKLASYSSSLTVLRTFFFRRMSKKYSLKIKVNQSEEEEDKSKLQKVSSSNFLNKPNLNAGRNRMIQILNDPEARVRFKSISSSIGNLSRKNNSTDIEIIMENNSLIRNILRNNSPKAFKRKMSDIQSESSKRGVSYRRNAFGSDLIKNKISNASKRTQKYSRTLKVLFVISSTFLLLNCPMAVNKFLYFFKYHQTDFSEVNGVNSNVFSQNEIKN